MIIGVDSSSNYFKFYMYTFLICNENISLMFIKLLTLIFADSHKYQLFFNVLKFKIQSFN